jgi:HD-like signal output (HDOD) protein
MSTPIVERLFAAIRSDKGFSATEKTVTSIIASLGDEKKGKSDLVGHIIEDFALTQRVLKLANSAMYAPFSQGASNISSALDILGINALMHIVLSTVMVSEAELDDDAVLSQTLLASELARSVGGDLTEDVSIAALLYNLGQMMLAKYLPEESALMERHIASGMGEDAAATRILGMTLQQLGAEVAQQWKLPSSIISIIAGTGDQSMVSIAKFSRSAASLIYAGKSEEVAQLVADLDVPASQKNGVAALVMHRAEYVRARHRPARQATSEDLLKDLLADLSENKRQSVESIAAAMFTAFSQVLKTAHCLLFMLTKSGDYAVRYGYGKGIDELRSKLRISKDYKPTAFHAAIKNNVDVSIADVSRLKSTALPEGFTMLLPHVNKFVILPIANSGVCGLVYCDWDSEMQLSSAELDVVKKLRNIFLPYFPA